MRAIRALWREPLVRFLALGALLFVAYAVAEGDGGRGREGRQILITPGRIGQLESAFRAQRLRPPTRDELDGLVQDHVRQEVLYREAVRLGIDRDDVVIRRRLAQKMEFLQEDVASVAAPSDRDLERFLARHPDLFREPIRIAFQQIYFSADRRGGEGASDAARSALERLRRHDGASIDAKRLGDPTLLPAEVTERSAREVAGLFGEEFADSLLRAPVGIWSGPVRSSYGFHAVRVGARREARMPPLADVRGRVESEWRRAERARANDEAFAKMVRRYAVVVDTAGSAR